MLPLSSINHTHTQTLTNLCARCIHRKIATTHTQRTNNISCDVVHILYTYILFPDKDFTAEEPTTVVDDNATTTTVATDTSKEIIDEKKPQDERYD